MESRPKDSRPSDRRRREPRSRGRRTGDGFTLVELLVVLVIVGVLAAIVYPTYQNFAMDSRRAEAHAALSDAASRQEQFFLDNRTYTTTVGAGGLNASTTTAGGYYTISVDAATATCLIAQCFALSATPQGVQADDSCGAITLNSGGDKGPSGCW